MGERHTMLRMLRSFALIALVLAAVPMVLSGPALAQYREFSGKVDKISKKKIFIDNRMGDKVFDETVVEGEKTEWDKIKKNDWVSVSWKFVDKPRKAYKVMVKPAPEEAGEDM
jgi:DNA modification methylase